MVPFESFVTVSYLRYIATMAVFYRFDTIHERDRYPTRHPDTSEQREPCMQPR